MTAWEQRKSAEVAAKLESLRADLERWSVRSSEGNELEKHHSQVRRLERHFSPVVDRLDAEVHAGPVAERWRALERAVQDLWSVWGFFRDKLALRSVHDYGSYLAAADDFAWQCFLPAQVAAIATGKVEETSVHEPALTCLEDVGSPFSLVRGGSYEGELSPTHRLTGSSRELLRRLPIPVIGVPWFQLQHLPDALVIAHEVGHHVLADLHLEEDVVRALGAADHGETPLTWAAEMFCDVVGTICAGSAFAAGLGDFLRVTLVADGASDWYPPASTRLAVCLGVLELEEVGSEGAAVRLRKQWESEGLTLSPADNTTGRLVAQALGRARFSSLGRLVDLDHFTAAMEQDRDEQAAELLALRGTTTHDIRVLLAAGSAAFAMNPVLYRERQVTTQVLAAAAEIRDPGVRWTAGRNHEVLPEQATVAREADAIYDLLTRDRTEHSDAPQRT